MKIKYDDVRRNGIKIRFGSDGAISQEQLRAMDDETLKFVRKVLNEHVERGLLEVRGLNEHGEPVYRGVRDVTEGGTNDARENDARERAAELAAGRTAFWRL